MTTSNEMQRLRDVLDAFGADRSRWPDQDRAVLEPFVAQNAEAGRLIAQEAEFDSLLARAPDGVSAVSVERARKSLMAEVEADGKSVSAATNVVPLVHKTKAEPRVPPPGGLWRDFAVMAAALLIGFFTVSRGVLDGSALDPARLMAGVAGESDDVSAVALGGTGEELLQEELL